jgi:hypothetical protein
MKGKHTGCCITNLKLKSCKCHTCAKDDRGCTCVDKFGVGSCFIKDCPDFTPETDEFEPMNIAELPHFQSEKGREKP